MPDVSSLSVKIRRWFVSSSVSSIGSYKRLAAALTGVLWAFAVLWSMAAGATGIESYQLGPGDRLKITVFGHEDASGEFEVDGAGNIAYPLLGQLQAQGQTPLALMEHVRTELDRNFIVDPRISVEVLRYRPFYIYGEVEKSGSYPYVAGLTVRRAVAIAGGFSRRARHAPVLVVRESGEDLVKLDAELETPVLPGDILEIDRRLF